MLGFIFLPLLLLKPNAISPTGETFNLFQLEGDFRYMFLFGLCVVAFGVSWQNDIFKRGWLLVLLGNAVMILSLWLPTIAGQDLLANAAEILGGDPRGPRVQPVSAIATGLGGGYIILFGGLADLRRADVGRVVRFIAGWIGVLIMGWMVYTDKLDIYSVMVEYNINGDNLGDDTLKHLAFVLVALVTGLLIGVSLGLWSSRDENVAPILLYSVGIIQTVPSLALFGLLLVPLSDLGRESFTQVLGYLAVAYVVLVIVLGLIRILGNRLNKTIRPYITLLGVLFLVPPLAITTLMINSFLFRITFQAMTSDDYQLSKNVTLLAIVLSVALIYVNRGMALKDHQRRYLSYVRLGLVAVVIIGIVVVLGQSASDYLPDDPLADWTLSTIGIAGIGVAPTLVALTLYSLLPLTRNTYVGLNNVDPAIIDSGRGMGMTPAQIFFQIELPLAFPVIMAGVRNAAIALIGIATIATVIGGGGLGDYVIDGINNISIDKILLGTIPAILLAFALDFGLQAFEITATSPGIRHTTNRTETA